MPGVTGAYTSLMAVLVEQPRGIQIEGIGAAGDRVEQRR
jgi:hypothetical protein